MWGAALIIKRTIGVCASRALAYDYGLGKSMEHHRPHRVAGTTPGENWRERARIMDTQLRMRADMQRGKKGRVIRLAVAAAPQDRVMSDREWAAIASQTVNEYTLGHGADHTWEAVRHDPRHIHITLLQRDNSGKLRHDLTWQDKIRNNTICANLERDYTLERSLDGERARARDAALHRQREHGRSRSHDLVARAHEQQLAARKAQQQRDRQNAQHQRDEEARQQRLAAQDAHEAAQTGELEQQREALRVKQSRSALKGWETRRVRAAELALARAAHQQRVVERKRLAQQRRQQVIAEQRERELTQKREHQMAQQHEQQRRQDAEKKRRQQQRRGAARERVDTHWRAYAGSEKKHGRDADMYTFWTYLVDHADRIAFSAADNEKYFRRFLAEHSIDKDQARELSKLSGKPLNRNWDNLPKPQQLAWKLEALPAANREGLRQQHANRWADQLTDHEYQNLAHNHDERAKHVEKIVSRYGAAGPKDVAELGIHLPAHYQRWDEMTQTVWHLNARRNHELKKPNNTGYQAQRMPDGPQREAAIAEAEAQLHSINDRYDAYVDLIEYEKDYRAEQAARAKPTWQLDQRDDRDLEHNLHLHQQHLERIPPKKRDRYTAWAHPNTLTQLAEQAGRDIDPDAGWKPLHERYALAHQLVTDICIQQHNQRGIPLPSNEKNLTAPAGIKLLGRPLLERGEKFNADPQKIREQREQTLERRRNELDDLEHNYSNEYDTIQLKRDRKKQRELQKMSPHERKQAQQQQKQQRKGRGRSM